MIICECKPHEAYILVRNEITTEIYLANDMKKNKIEEGNIK